MRNRYGPALPVFESRKSQLRQYSKYSSEANGQNGSESRNDLRKRPQSKVPNRDRYSMANLFGPPTSKKQKVKAQSEAEGFFLGGSESDEDETENQESEKSETEKETSETSADLELKDLVKKQKLFVEKGSKKEAILKEWSHFRRNSFIRAENLPGKLTQIRFCNIAYII